MKIAIYNHSKTRTQKNHIKATQKKYFLYRIFINQGGVNLWRKKKKIIC